MTVVRWETKFKKSNGELRKTFSLWSIPRDQKIKYGLSDQTKGNLSIVFNGRTLESWDVKLTSGTECPVKKKISDQIRIVANRRRGGSVCFTLKVSSSPELKDLGKIRTNAGKEAESNSSPKVEDSAEARFSQRLVSTRVRKKRVVQSALDRAKGKCEMCRKRAPFTTTRRQPYLEVHHIRSFKDGGIDVPDNAAAICPNCHREAHYGEPKAFCEKVKRAPLFNTQ